MPKFLSELAKRFLPLFLQYCMEKLKGTFWPTQYTKKFLILKHYFKELQSVNMMLKQNNHKFYSSRMC